MGTLAEATVIDWSALGSTTVVTALFGWLITVHLPALEERYRNERRELMAEFQKALDKIRGDDGKVG